MFLFDIYKHDENKAQKKYQTKIETRLKIC